MTVSAGLRWEYYPLSRRADRGLEVFDFATSELMICGVSGNDPTCGITVEKDLFTPRVGWAYRASESTVIRVGYSRNPENDTSGRNQMPPFQAFPATIILAETAPNTYTAVGSLSDGVTIVPQFDLTVGRVRPNAGLTTYRGKFVRGTITSWNASVQQLLPFGQSLTLGYVANRQRGITRNLNENYGHLVGALRVSRIEHSRPRPSTCKGRTGESTSIRFRRASTSGSHPVFSTRRHTHLPKRSTGGRGRFPSPSTST
jgi:hypothetical protein